MAASSSEIYPYHATESSNEYRPQTTVSNGIDFFPAATDFVFCCDVDFHRRYSATSSQIHVHLLQRPLLKTDSVFLRRFVESHPIVFFIRGTSSNFGIYPPTLPMEQAKPLVIPFISVKGPDANGMMWIAHGDGRLIGWVERTKRRLTGLAHHRVFDANGTLRFGFNTALRCRGVPWTNIICLSNQESVGFFRPIWKRSELGEHPPRKESWMSASFHLSIVPDERLLLFGIASAFALRNAKRDFGLTSSWKKAKERLGRVWTSFRRAV